MEIAKLQCRACLSAETATRKHKSLSENGLSDIFRDLTQIQISEVSTFTKVCLKCVKQLKSFSEFREQCLESNKYFEDVLNNPTKVLVKDENQDLDVEVKDEPEVHSESDDKLKIEPEEDSESNEESEDEPSKKSKNITKRGPYKKKSKNSEEKAVPALLFCKNCPDKIFTNKYYFRQHLKSHNEGPYECHFCGRKYHKKSFLHGHIDRNHIEKDFAKKGDFACHLCERRYLTDFRLKQHLGIHRLKEKACPFCGKLTRHLTSHLLKHEQPAERFQCDKCEKNYKSEKHLQLHAIVHENKLFPCAQCGKAFNTPEKVQAHMRNMHNPNRPTFECSVCHKHFYYRKYLTGHMRMHTGEKPYQCSYCDMSFAVRNNLTKHLHVHMNTKPYMCKYCNYGTRRKPQFLEHLRQNHLEEQKLEEAATVPPVIVSSKG
ncbi:zinc finger protein 470-like [Culicoides brevitarsis]|uniref:zinc finger protein 470-like n=1 Tax=Culicoides brevitarsis TaxID=469753 RepID=UPI00307B934C